MIDQEINQSDKLVIATSSLTINASMVPWDIEAFRFPVAQIDHIEIVDYVFARTDFSLLNRWIENKSIGLVSCRLSHDKLNISMFLEEQDYRFVEMIFPAELSIEHHEMIQFPALEVHLADKNDLKDALSIANTAFRNERYYCDPRLSTEASNRRYFNWVLSTGSRHSQELYVVKDRTSIVAFFVTEMQENGCWYWHLNAVSPNFYGRGMGFAAAQKMFEIARAKGAKTIRTAFTARNLRALNLNARLGFRFMHPLMTFHWVRP